MVSITRRGRRRSLAALIGLAIAWPCLAGGPEPAALPPDDVLEAGGAVIGDIRVSVGDVFDPSDPKEDRRLFLFANRLHRTTRPSVVLDQLLVHPGEPFSRRLLEESERLLRKNRYFYDAEIRPVRYDGNRVDLEVVTRDVWTLNVGASVGRSGGVGSTGFQIQDANLLGTGKSLTLKRSSDVDRTSSIFRYEDPAVWGTRAELGLQYSDSSDGRLRELELGRPFYSLDARWSAHLTALSGDQVDTLYELGHATAGVRHQQDRFEVRGGLSRGLVDGRVDRWSAGLTWHRERFSLADPSPTGEGREADYGLPGGLPDERILAYPWIAWDRVPDHFLEARNLDQIQRTEDLELGTRLHGRLGLASGAFGSTETAAVFEATAATGWKPSADQTLLLSSDLSGRWGRGGAGNLLAGGTARYYWRDWGEHLLFLTLTGDVARNLDPGEQLLLGGDSGLRGYPLRYQDGEGRLLFTAEQRLFTGFHPFRLVHVGGAVFFDAGRTWGGGASDLGWLRDVGVGLRLSSSRSGLGNVVHVDLAFPLDGDPSIKSMQWLVTTKTSF